MPNLTPSQLAEGARLLGECKSDPNPRTLAAWSQWRTDHGEALMLRVAEVEGCVREAIVELKHNAAEFQRTGNLCMDDLDGDALLNKSVAYGHAARIVESIATVHNIDLSEPGNTKPPKGQKEGGDCPVQ